MSTNLDLVFRPVVTLEDGIVRAYRAIPVDYTDDGIIIGERAVMREEDDPVDTAEHNEKIVSLAVAAIEKAHAAGVALNLANDMDSHMAQVGLRTAARGLPLYVFEAAQRADIHEASENGAVCVDGAVFGKHLTDIGPETNGLGIAALKTIDLE